MLEKSKPVILVVEDDEICRSLAVRQLRHLGFVAHCAANGKEAIDQLSKNTYSLILMDLQMPVMGGIEATKVIRTLEEKTNQRIPIVAVTANPDRDLCMKAGMDDFIFKPASLDDLRQILNRWLPQELPATASYETKLEELDRLRVEGLEARRMTQQEREIIQKRRGQIENQRRSLTTNGSEGSLIELLTLQDEVTKLQDRIANLNLVTIRERKEFDDLIKRANGLWEDFSSLPEQSQLRQETIQSFAEAIQKLHEDVQQQEEHWEKRERSKSNKQ